MRRRHGSKIMWVSNPVIALEELSRLPASDRALVPGQCPGLAEYLK
jgi:hypothetical protein